MRDIQILQQTIENQCPEIHKKRLKSLILATKAVLDGSDLTLTKIGRPVVLVDWSDVREQLRYMKLRASVPVKGRAVTLYEQAFEYKSYNSPKSHHHFLDKLQSLLPKGCTPIIVSDAGFRNT